MREVDAGAKPADVCRKLGVTETTQGHERDQLGRITRRAETYPTTRTLDYAYDTAGRLSTVSNGGSTVESYSYDANGNRTGWTNGSGTWTCSTVDAQDRLGTCTDSTNTLTFTYDRNGDRLTRTRTSQPTQTYTYDAFGNLLSVVPSSGSRIDYVIDGQGRRVGKKVAGSLTRQWVWGSQLRPVAELDGSGTVLARFVYATHVNVPDLIIKSGTVYRVLTDHLGSVRAIVNAGSGAVAQTFDYDSYGNIISASPALGYSGQEGLQTFGFAGGLYDGDTKLVRFGARDYDAEIGRWLSKDPLIFAARGVNLYAYSSDDPINNLDPNGLDYLTFDGRTISWHYTDNSPFGRSGDSRDFPANSGGSEGALPIPSGGYWTSPKQRTDRSDNTSAWGNFSYKLWPDKNNHTKRDGFNIHSGDVKGTHGCIEMRAGEVEGDYDKTMTQDLMDELDHMIQKYGKPIHVQVE